MAANLLTRRLAGLSLSSTVAPRPFTLGRNVQPNRLLTNLLGTRANDSPSPSTPPPHRLPSASALTPTFRWMSTVAAASTSPQGNQDFTNDVDNEESSISSEEPVIHNRWGRHGQGFHPNGDLRPPKYRKVKPSIVKRRMRGLKTYVGTQKNIRYSPWRMNLICQFIPGMTVPEAENQLRFVRKRKAPLMRHVLKKTANLADIRDGLQPSQLEVAECFATHGHHLRRMKFHARGKSGIMHRRHCHIRLVLREIDFPLKVALATTEHQKRRWLEKMRLADLDGAEAQEEREELERLEREAAARRAKEEEEKK